MLTIESRLLVCAVLITGFFAVINLSVPAKTSVKALLKGNVAQQIERDYDDKFPTRNFAVNLWTALSVIMFNEGKPGLELGTNGWMYSQEEFIAEKSTQETYLSNLDYIKSVAHTLGSHQLTLVIVPVPTKARIYPENIGNRLPDPAFTRLYQQFRKDLSDLNILSIDSAATLRREKTRHPVFLRTDTHWTPEGAAAVAVAVSNATNIYADTLYERQALAPILYDGDLTNFLPLSPWFEQLTPASDVLTRWQFVAAGSESDLFAEPATPSTVLIGTSYSHNENWHFADSLRHAMGTDLINLSESGNGPFKPMETFIEQHLRRIPNNRVVIWEIPERYLISSAYQPTRGDSS